MRKKKESKKLRGTREVGVGNAEWEKYFVITILIPWNRGC